MDGVIVILLAILLAITAFTLEFFFRDRKDITRADFWGTLIVMYFGFLFFGGLTYGLFLLIGFLLE